VVRSRRIVGIALVLGLGGFAQVSIQPRPQPASKEPGIPSANLRVDTNLVLVPVTVNDELNHPVTGLERENFRVFDDKMAQTITAFSTEDEPIALGLVFDVSGSMGGTLPKGREAAARFLKLANPEDEFFLVEFASAPRLVIPLTSNTGQISTEVLLTKSKGSTALFDALYLAINEMRKSKKTKKALVLISDGGENNSRYTQKELDTLVRESDVLIYTILVPGSDADPALMNRIAEMTGAHGYGAAAYELPDIALKICIELRNRYVLGYAPQDTLHDGRYHRIEVKLAPPRGLPKLRAHWRLGYFAPSD
jgi:VWFA-related protein